MTKYITVKYSILIALLVLSAPVASINLNQDCWTRSLSDLQGGHHEDINPRCVVDVRELMKGRSGYGMNAQGAWPLKSTLYVVDSTSDSGQGTFRDAIDVANEKGYLWIVLKGSGTINASERYWLHDTSHITIDGRYSSKKLRRGPLRIWRAKHVILTGLDIAETITAPLALHKVNMIYATELVLGDSAHHSFSVSGAPKHSYSNITLSHSVLLDREKSMLIGSFNDSHSKKLYVTLHNIRTVGANRRSPLVAHANVHIFNSYIPYKIVGVEVFENGHVWLQGTTLNNVGRGRKEAVRHVARASGINLGSYSYADLLLIGDNYPLTNTPRPLPWYTRGAYSEKWDDLIVNETLPE